MFRRWCQLQKEDEIYFEIIFLVAEIYHSRVGKKSDAMHFNLETKTRLQLPAVKYESTQKST